MRVEPAFFPSMGFDTVAKLSPDKAASLYEWGMSFAVRYLGSIDSAELQGILDSGLAFMPVMFSRAPGWKPSQALGAQDGASAVKHLQDLKLPPGVTVWFDLEGASGNVADTSAHINAWAQAIKAAGFDPGLYVGAGQALNSQELYALAVDRYWHSLSRGVPEPATVGWCMEQLYPPNVTIEGVQLDVNVVRKDFGGRLPNWVVGF